MGLIGIGGIPSLHSDATTKNFLAQEIRGFVDAGEKNRASENLMGFPAMRMVAEPYPLHTKADCRFAFTVINRRVVGSGPT